VVGVPRQHQSGGYLFEEQLTALLADALPPLPELHLLLPGRRLVGLGAEGVRPSIEGEVGEEYGRWQPLQFLKKKLVSSLHLFFLLFHLSKTLQGLNCRFAEVAVVPLKGHRIDRN